MAASDDPTVSTAWLAEQMGAPDLRILDAPFYLPGDPRTPQGEFAAQHIPGAQLFDINAIADPSTDLPHMLAPPQAFAEAVGRLGVGDGDRVVVYDHVGLMSAARVWWNLRAMGHDQVWVLDGGLPRWLAEGRTTESGPATASMPRVFTPRFRPYLVRGIDEVKAVLANGGQVLDARAAGRFSGADPEPRPGLSSGHMPGAFNLPHASIVRDGALLPADELKGAVAAAGVDIGQPIVTTCGSGVSAAVLSLALARLGHPDAPVYDGSWTEWAGRTDSEIVKG